MPSLSLNSLNILLMKTIFAAFLLSVSLAQAQNPIHTKLFPCAQKSLTLEGLEVEGRTRQEIASLLCEYTPFASGEGFLVYRELSDGIAVITNFSFENNLCDQLTITFGYDDIATRDASAKQMILNLNRLYGTESNQMEEAMNYASIRREPCRTFVWTGFNSILRMDLKDGQEKKTIELTRKYQTR